MFSIFQFIRVIPGITGHWLMGTEMALSVVVSTARTFIMLVYYKLYTSMDLNIIITISAIPQIFLSWVFTLLIFAWVAILKKAEDVSFKKFVPYLIGINVVLIVAQTTFYVLLAFTSQHSHEIATIGATLASAVNVTLSIFFGIYGYKLVRALTRDFASKFAPKLVFVGASFSTALVLQSIVVMVSTYLPDVWEKHFILLNSVYFSLDVVMLITMHALFFAPINAIKNTAVSRTGTKLTRAKTRKGKRGKKGFTRTTTISTRRPKV
jgi:hypothetical protein